MSRYDVLRELSLHVQQLLFDGLAGDSAEIPGFDSISRISLDSPATLASGIGTSGAEPSLSWYLYQVLPNAHLNNGPLPRTAEEQHHLPLSLDLHYLLTPLRTSPTDNLLILGRAMQLLAAQPSIRADFLDSLLRPNPPEVRVRINPCSLEELTRIWNAFNQPYRLSVCYLLQVVSIDSARLPQSGKPVREVARDLHRLLPNGERR